MDERVKKAKILRAAKKSNPAEAISAVRKTFEAGLDDLQDIIYKCERFGFEYSQIENKIKKINDWIWNIRSHLAWKRNCPNSNFAEKYLDVHVMVTTTVQTSFAHMFFDGQFKNTVETITRVHPRESLGYGMAIVALNEDCSTDNDGMKLP